MRGVVPLEFPVPVGGWRTDRPPHRLPPDVLRDGQNMVVDRDGLLKPRAGYEPIGEQPNTDGLPDERIMGGLFWEEETTIEMIVATLTRWYAFQAGVWQDITDPASPESGEPGAPTRFAQFAVVNGREAVYGVNGALHEPMRRWTPDMAVYETVKDVAQNFELAAADIAVVANRLVAVNTTEGGVNFPRRVRWSAVNDGASWPALAFEDIQGDAGHLIAIQPASRTTAIIYAANGAWVLSAQEGSDASAFRLDRLQGAYAAPFSPAAIVNVGGVHFYLATDLHIWRCDGQSANPISIAIDAGLRDRLAVGSNQKPASLYDALRQWIWFFVTFQGDADNQNAIVFDLLLGVWFVPQRFDGPAITAAFPVIEFQGPTWNNPGSDASGNIYTWNTAPWVSWNAIPFDEEPAIWIGTSDGFISRFFSGGTDHSAAVGFTATWGQRTPDDASERYEFNCLECYQDIGASELLRVQVDGLRQPYDAVPVSLLDRQIPEDDPLQWLMRFEPLVGQKANRPANLQQLTISGSTTATSPHVAGLMAYGFPVRRPDFVDNVTGIP